LTAFDRISAWFEMPQAHEFYGEQVTIAQHMLQAAAIAAREDAPPELIAAALLHDVGHLVPGLNPDERNRDHADLALQRLSPMFAEEVTEPIRLHIEAKRYLVATEPDYASKLSAASVHTLKLQGGPLDSDGCTAFMNHRFAQDALKLRRWDEAAKDAGADTPSLETYRDVVELLT